MTPIYATSTYVQSSPGVHKGFDYGRSHNPTRWAFERCVADLEGGAQAFAFASGLAAIATVLELLDAGSHVVACDDIYGGTFRLFERVRRRSAGLDFSYVDLADLRRAASRRSRRDTRMIWVETPTNPLLKLADLAAMAAIARERGILARGRQHLRHPVRAAPAGAGLRHRGALDHQVPQRPLRHDRRRGHRRREPRPGRWRERLGFLQNAVGAIAGPFDSFLALRGVKTLALRMERHCEQCAGAGAVAGGAAEGGARALSRAWPVAPAARAGASGRCSGFGGMVSIELEGRPGRRAALPGSGASSSRWPKAWAASKA